MGNQRALEGTDQQRGSSGDFSMVPTVHSVRVSERGLPTAMQYSIYIYR